MRASTCKQADKHASKQGGITHTMSLTHAYATTHADTHTHTHRHPHRHTHRHATSIRAHFGSTAPAPNLAICPSLQAPLRAQ